MPPPKPCYLLRKTHELRKAFEAATVRDELELKTHLETQKFLLGKLYVHCGLKSDAFAFELHYDRLFNFMKDWMLNRLEDDDPALAARVDDREEWPAYLEKFWKDEG
jgi:hypothetical protein